MISSKDLLKKRILIFGSNGNVGQYLSEAYKRDSKVELLCCSYENESFVEGVEYKKLDVAQKGRVKDIILEFFPDFIINAAAYTNVDKCETEREEAWKVNVSSVEFITQYARIIDAHIIHFSTDYVFNGKDGPYTEKDKPYPINYYGRTKHASENALRIGGAKFTIIRTNVLYGDGRDSVNDFVNWTINKLIAGEKIDIVTDQINNPTFIPDLVFAVKKVINYEKDGIYNIGGDEFLSRYNLSKRIARFFNLDEKLIYPTKTKELKQPAARPLKSGLVTLKAGTELNYKPLSIKETFIKIKQLRFDK